MVVKRRASHRLRRADWLEIGLAALAEHGPAGLTIEALCRRASKTKGSFYAHFPSVEACLAALAEHWHETFTLQVMQEADRSGAPDEKLAALDRLALALDSRIEQGMRRLAQIDAGVARVCADVDRERIGYLARLHGETGRFDAGEALALARFEYAAFVGFQQIELGLAPEEAHADYRLFLRLIGSDPGVT